MENGQSTSDLFENEKKEKEKKKEKKEKQKKKEKEKKEKEKKKKDTRSLSKSLFIIPSIFKRKELSKNITHILNQLVNPTLYDKRLRPNYGGPPVDVGITIYVSSISAVSEVEMDFTLDFYLRQMWTDPRLGFEEKYGLKKDLTVGIEYLTHIWVPDTFFPNEKKSFFHKATTHNSFLRIKSNGEVMTSQRLTVTANCPMQLQLFPLDSQKCSLEIESYGYDTRDISYTWFKGIDSVSTANVSLPQFQLSESSIKEKLAQLSTGAYSRLIVRFMFTRQIGFYMIQIYLPSILIVIISWVSFWLSRDATPARVSLGVTTVLTMTTLMTTTNAAMPKVSYIKSIDIYLGTCFLMVFASLLEYAAVGYLNKKLRMKREAKIKQQTQSNDHFGGLGGGGTGALRPPMFSSAAMSTPNAAPPAGPYKSMDTTNRGGYDSRFPQPPTTPAAAIAPPPSATTMKLPQTHLVPECDCDLDVGGKRNALAGVIPTNTNTSVGGMGFGGSVGGGNRKIGPQQFTVNTQQNHKKFKLMAVYPSSIDKYSRMVFPLSFAAFNAMYWTIYMHISDDKLGHEEDGYSEDHIRMLWKKGSKSVNIEDGINMPSFEIGELRIYSKPTTLSSGVYSRLHLFILLERAFGYYAIQIYLPSMMVVSISWISFWVTRESAPARVTLGVITVLAITTLITITNRALPPVSYVKAVDIYLSICYFFVFAALLEFAVVSYSSKRKKDYNSRRAKLISQKQAKANRSKPVASIIAPDIVAMDVPEFRHEGISYDSTICTCDNNIEDHYHHHIHHRIPPPPPPPRLIAHPSPADAAVAPSSTQWADNTYIDNVNDCVQHRTHHRNYGQQLSSTIMDDNIIVDDHGNDHFQQQQSGGPPSPKTSTTKYRPVSNRKTTFLGRYDPSAVDRYSRFCFPFLFIIFNAIYWSVFIIKRNNSRHIDFEE